MRVHVLLFAILRERLGRDSLDLDLEEGTSVAGAVSGLAAAHAAVAALAPLLRVAVNQTMAAPAQILHDGDELALIPPVAGGAGRLLSVVSQPPSVDRVIAAVAGPEMGGVVVFVGLVRAESHGRAVTRLEYEAYAAMAEKVFAEICDELEGEHPGVRLAVEHRVGALAVGDVAVALAAAAPHRAEAFAACRALIDRLKERAPIWKKELGPDGAEWVGLDRSDG